MLKLLVWFSMLSWLGLNPESSKSKIYHWIFEKTQILVFPKLVKIKNWHHFYYKKNPAATRSFCKRNFIQTSQIWEINFLFRVALTCTTAGLGTLWTAGYPPNEKTNYNSIWRVVSKFCLQRVGVAAVYLLVKAASFWPLLGQLMVVSAKTEIMRFFKNPMIDFWFTSSRV